MATDRLEIPSQDSAREDGVSRNGGGRITTVSATPKTTERNGNPDSAVLIQATYGVAPTEYARRYYADLIKTIIIVTMVAGGAALMFGGYSGLMSPDVVRTLTTVLIGVALTGGVCFVILSRADLENVEDMEDIVR